jgi:hypothetical protein
VSHYTVDFSHSHSHCHTLTHTHDWLAIGGALELQKVVVIKFVVKVSFREKIAVFKSARRGKYYQSAENRPLWHNIVSISVFIVIIIVILKSCVLSKQHLNI